MKHDDESKPGSASYSRSLANTLARTVEEGADLGPTDTELCILALRYHADRRRRRIGFAVALAIVAGLGVALTNLDLGGRAGLADLGAAVRAIAPTSFANATLTAPEKKDRKL